MGNIRFLNLDYIFYQVYRFFVWVGDVLYGNGGVSSTNGTSTSTGGTTGMYDGGTSSGFDATQGIFGVSFLQILEVTFGLIILALIGMIFFSILRWREELAKHNEKYKKAYKEPVPVVPFYKHQKWPVVLAHADSVNASEWRLAILEADNMLGELLSSRNIPGATIGERLTSADAKNFKTLSSAWDAHKVRNRIAHEGADFELSQRETKRVVGLYEEVFREFNFI